MYVWSVIDNNLKDKFEEMNGTKVTHKILDGAETNLRCYWKKRTLYISLPQEVLGYNSFLTNEEEEEEKVNLELWNHDRFIKQERGSR